MRKDSLEKRLQSRPKAEDLVREGILTGMYGGVHTRQCEFLASCRAEVLLTGFGAVF